MDPQKYYEHLTPLYCRLIGHQWHLGYWVNASNLQEAITSLTELMASRPELSREMSVLDLGCGVGGTVCWLADRFGCRVIGVSNSRAGLAEADRWTLERGLQDRAEYQFADVVELPFDGDHFDVVWSCEAIHNVADQEAVISELTRVLKPGGTVILGDIFQLREPTAREPVSEGLQEYGFHLRTADQWIASLETHGIRVRESVSIGHHVGEASLSVCTSLFEAEAENHDEGSVEKGLCQRTAAATQRLRECFNAGEISWGIWFGVKQNGGSDRAS